MKSKILVALIFTIGIMLAGCGYSETPVYHSSLQYHTHVVHVHHVTVHQTIIHHTTIHKTVINRPSVSLTKRR